MAFNVPSYDTSKISFGPGVLYMDVWTGTSPPNTPSIDILNDIGALSEDGISVELTSDKRYIAQGNPRLNIFGVSQVQSVSVSVTGIEWNVNTFKRAIGSGTVATGGSEDTFAWGGDPSCVEVGLVIKHKQITGYDLMVYVWKAVSETGFSLPFGQDEHSFEYRFNALHSSVDFGSTAITDNLIYMSRGHA
jgi:hypothetical protein